MNTDTAAHIIWEYMLMHQELKPADLLLVLGSSDTRVAEYAATLYFRKLAPLILFSGSGSIHNHKPGREQFINSSEAQIFADIAVKKGVPSSAIIIENKSQNTGENYQMAIQKLHERGIAPKRIILVQKPYAERRVYATGKVWLPAIELIVTSPPLSFDEYVAGSRGKEHVINALVGDLQRIKIYPQKGFQIEQEMPAPVWSAFEFLVAAGYTENLVKDN
jgi:uncharacterized SAM-binding protein YcdF (DUF218 family)